MPSNDFKRISIVALLCLLLGLAIWLMPVSSNKLSLRPNASSGGFVSAAGDSSQSEVEALLRARKQSDETLWAKELLAQKHEAVFTSLWDNLRTDTNTLNVLGHFAFGGLILPEPGRQELLAHQINRSQLTNRPARLDPEQWRLLLGTLQDKGYRLDQSEWRHPIFEANADGTCHSLIAVTLHVQNPKTSERSILRGDLRVDWRAPGAPDSQPFPQVIDATGLELLVREGQPAFRSGTSIDITPEQIPRQFIEPGLQLYDLDGDGLSEIILATQNVVLWNKGGGDFRDGRLVSALFPTPRASVIADLDGDGNADLLTADATDLRLYHGNGKGGFIPAEQPLSMPLRGLANPVVITVGDVDGDGDLDVWLGQYKVPYQSGQMPTPYYDANDGYPSFLFLNDGKGHFRDATEGRGLGEKRFRRTYSASMVDLDEDGDLDLVVVSDFAGVEIYYNDGRGHFSDATARAVDQRHAFGMAHAIADYDLDGSLDLLVIGMNSFAAQRLDHLGLFRQEFPADHLMRSNMTHGNRLYFKRGSHFLQDRLGEDIARTGWSWGVASGDFDNDGAPDVFIANGHISGTKTRDYDSEFWRHDIYAASSKETLILDRYFASVRAQFQADGGSYGGFEKNRFFLNQAGKRFLEIGYLMGLASEEDCRNSVADDVDGDGRLDLLITTLQLWPTLKEELHFFPNAMNDAGNWIGIHLDASTPGLMPSGAKIRINTSLGTQVQALVTGDSYRSQHANTAHFGLGKLTQVESIEVHWPNGKISRLLHPAINQYHRISHSPSP